MHHPKSLAALVLLSFAAGSACMDTMAAKEHDAPDQHQMLFQHAVCVIQPTTNNSVSGVVHFTTLDGGKVEVEARISGLAPNSKHGFHIHQFGDATDPGGKSLGGHFNPEGHPHALPPAAMRHAGDLGNIVADASGNANFSATFDNFSLGGHNNVIGRGMVIHAKPDDGGQPTGNAGPRQAVGVIGLAK